MEYDGNTVRDEALPGTSYHRLRDWALILIAMHILSDSIPRPPTPRPPMPTFDITGQTTGDLARTGPRLAASPYPALAIFEIADRWQRSRPAELSRGPTHGINWWTTARLVNYWFNPSGGSEANDTYWDIDSSQDSLTPICLPIGGPGLAGSSSASESSGHSNVAWQKVLYPGYEIGQWVKCVFDHSVGVWRVMEQYEAIVRFELTEPLAPFGKANARVFGPGSSGSSSSEGRRWRGTISVHETIGAASADAGTCGYAKRFADSRKWEVLSLGSRRGSSSSE